MKKCNSCPVYSVTVKATSNNTTVDINASVNCKSTNIVYCKMQYFGESERSIQERFSEHKTYVASNQILKATGAHFYLPGHSISKMRVVIL